MPALPATEMASVGQTHAMSAHDELKTRRSGPRRRAGDVDENTVARTFGLRTVALRGPDARRLRTAWLNALYDACADLAEVMKIPPRFVGFDGRLAVSLRTGADGATHGYLPRARQIVLDMSEPSGHLAHAWTLAVDHLLGDLARQPTPMKAKLPHVTGREPLLSMGLPAYCQSGYRSYERFSILTPSMLEDRLDRAPSSPREDALVRAWMRFAVALRWHIGRESIDRTRYFSESILAEGRKTRPSKSAPHEMVARAVATLMSEWMRRRNRTNALLADERPGQDDNPPAGELPAAESAWTRVLPLLRDLGERMTGRARTQVAPDQDEDDNQDDPVSPGRG